MFKIATEMETSCLQNRDQPSMSLTTAMMRSVGMWFRASPRQSVRLASSFAVKAMW
jgi:hypothetical protein